MKLLVLFSLVLAITANAKPGSQCGLTDSIDDSWITTARRSLTDASDRTISNLPTLTKQQLIIAANEESKRRGENEKFQSAVEAVDYLRESSTSNDVTIIHMEVDGRRMVTLVEIYPGENPYGSIFAQGTRRVIAYEKDSSVECK